MVSLHLYNIEVENWPRPATRYAIDIAFNEPAHETLSGNVCLCGDNTIGFDYDYVLKDAAGWYKGDLHGHTLLSDGSQSIHQALDTVERQKLDFFFLTEHNVLHSQLPKSSKTLVIPGVEVTTGLGHMNVFAPKKGFVIDAGRPDCASSLEAGTLLGGICGINHPFMTSWCWQYMRMPLSAITTFEISCDPTWKNSEAFTRKALHALSALWNSGNDIWAVGGSDSHIHPHETYDHTDAPSIYGDPATYVYATRLSANGVLEGIKKGHTYVERRCDLDFTINGGKILPGDTVRKGDITYELSSGDTSQRYIVHVIADGEVIQKQFIEPKKGCRFTVDMASFRWMRVDVTDAEGNFAALVNPVRTHIIEPTATVWGDLFSG
jgi:hypothetical protein